jgi:hypothetical protein
MSKESALVFLESIKTKEVLIENMVRNFSLLGTISSSAWTEFFMDLDYSVFTSKMANSLDKFFTDEEIEELLQLSKTSVFQKYLNIHSSLSEEFGDESLKWFDMIRENELPKLERILKKYNVDEYTIKTVLMTFGDAGDIPANSNINLN